MNGFNIPKKSPRPKLSLVVPPQPTSPPKKQLNLTIPSKIVPDNPSSASSFTAEGLRVIGKVGEGSFGDVIKVLDEKTGMIMARKNVQIEPSTQTQIFRELQLLNLFSHDNIIKYYGFFSEDDHTMSFLMEYCDLGSLDVVYKSVYAVGGFISEDVLGKVAVSVLKGLTYLHEQWKVMHRDIKPSNILLTSKGEIKLCDFGVSNILENSIAKTFVGSTMYMAPERIKGNVYNIKADIWSLGLTLLELALGKFPLPFNTSAKSVPIFEMIDYIIKEPPPTVPLELVYSDANPNGRLSIAFSEFIRICLQKEQRPTPREMMQNPFINYWDATFVDVETWARAIAPLLNN
ncbi:kinase-like domain-containing protein [Paraphysoderma sedebokerense]|nr:kinase-like domain-containing protein [Paraphysoderma sedebokerense]